jgi:hypothetical protein
MLPEPASAGRHTRHFMIMASLTSEQTERAPADTQLLPFRPQLIDEVAHKRLIRGDYPLDACSCQRHRKVSRVCLEFVRGSVYGHRDSHGVAHCKSVSGFFGPETCHQNSCAMQFLFLVRSHSPAS